MTEYMIFIRLKNNSITAHVEATTPTTAMEAVFDKMTVRETREVVETRIIEITAMRKWKA